MIINCKFNFQLNNWKLNFRDWLFCSSSLFFFYTGWFFCFLLKNDISLSLSLSISKINLSNNNVVVVVVVFFLSLQKKNWQNLWSWHTHTPTHYAQNKWMLHSLDSIMMLPVFAFKILYTHSHTHTPQTNNEKTQWCEREEKKTWTWSFYMSIKVNFSIQTNKQNQV